MNLMELMVQIGVNDQASGVISGLATGVRSFAKVGVAAVGAVSAGMIAFAKSALDAGSQFDTSMSKVAAISKATGSDFDALRDKAIEMGDKTVFSASNAADAFTYMAMAGWKTGDMLDGIAGIMNLAAASGEDLATTADIVTDALTAFGLSASDAGHFADVLAAASSNANTNVGMMGDTFKYVAPVAGALGFSIEDTALAIGLMANAGIKGSMAGTQLRNIMNSLTGPIKLAGQNLKEVTIETKNADGSMRDLGSIISDLRGPWSQLTAAEQANIAKTLVGEQAMSGFMAIMNASAEDVEKLTEALSNCSGEAERMAEAMTDNLAGDITKFKSALETAKIELSDKLTPSLRNFVQFGTTGLKRVVQAFKEGGLSGAMEEFGQVLSQGLNMIISKLPAFTDAAIKLTGSFVKGIIDNLPTIIDAALQIVGSLLSALVESLPMLLEMGSQLMQMVGNGIQAAGAWVVGIAHNIWTDILGGSEETWQQISTSTSEAWGSITQGLSNAWGVIKENAAAFGEGIKNFWGEHGDSIMQKFADTWSLISGKLSEYWDSIAALAGSVFNGLQSFWSTWGDTIIGNFESAWEIITTAFSGFVDVITATFDVFAALFNGDWEGFWDSILNLGVTLWTAITDTLKAIWDGLQTFGANVWATIKDDVAAAWESIQETATSMWEAIKTAIADVWDGIVTSVSSYVESIKTTITDTWNSISTSVSGTLTSISNSVSSVFDSISSTVSSVWNSIKDTISGTIDGAKNAVKTAIDDILKIFDFDWSFPELKLPHFKITGSFSLNPPSVPKLSISWYKKAYETPYLFDKPTVVGNKGFGDGNGAEIVYGHAQLMNDIKRAFAETNMQRMNIKLYLDGDKLVGGTSERMDSNLGQMQAYQLRWEGA